MDIEYFLNNWKYMQEEDTTFSAHQWEYISQHKYLSEEFIEKYQDKVGWHVVSAYQRLSEEFIEKHKDKVDWYWIAGYQQLSVQFIFKYQSKISFNSFLGCLDRCLQIRLEKSTTKDGSHFLIYSHQNYALIIKMFEKNKNINIQNTPSNILFSEVL